MKALSESVLRGMLLFLLPVSSIHCGRMEVSTSTATSSSASASLNFMSQSTSSGNLSPIPWSLGRETFTALHKPADGPGANYANYPSMIRDASGLHMWFCGTGQNGAMDTVRYTKSTNGRNWSPPQIVLAVSHQFPENEKGTCDPTVVRANLGDGLFYYMLYTIHSGVVGTAMNMARSATPEGPFAKLTANASPTWTVNATNPRISLHPRKFVSTAPAGTDFYGAGSPTMVFKNGELYVWYSDDTVNMPGSPRNHVYQVRSRDGIRWSAPVLTTYDRSSMEIKIDPATGRFVWFEIEDAITARNRLVRMESVDGLSFSGRQVICDTNCFPNFAGNLGVSADERGQLINDDIFFAFGAPVDFAPHWALMGEMIAGLRLPKATPTLGLPSPSLAHPVQRFAATQLSSYSDCIEVHHASYLLAGTWLVKNPCSAGFTKSFQFSRLADGNVRLFTAYGPKCITRNAEHSVAQIENCDGNVLPHQVLRIERLTAANFNLRHVQSGLCLQWTNDFLQFRPCSGEFVQIFRADPAASP